MFLPLLLIIGQFTLILKLIGTIVLTSILHNIGTAEQ